MRCWINGIEQAHIDATDRGLQYGDGLFETLAAFDGQCPWFEVHYQRLWTGCDRLAIPLPDKAVLLREVEQAAAGQHRAVIKIILTAGSGGRGYARSANLQANRIVLCHAWPDYAEACWLQGVELKLCQTRLGCNPALAGIKHLNRLEQVLARNEWQTREVAEGLMCDMQGNVIEGTMSNVFVVREQDLYTPELARCGVAGVMRRWILETAPRLGFEVHETTLRIEDLQHADELMLANSLIGLWPVKMFESRHYQPGPVYQALLKCLLTEYPLINTQTMNRFDA
jgi:4-amino-4-deoxychorismate lyase